MKCSLPARIRLVHSCTANWSGRLLIALAPIFYSSSNSNSRREGAAGRCRGSEQQAAGNSLSARLTNCVKALQQSANRFCCTSVPCSGALVASASSSSDGQQQQQKQRTATRTTCSRRSSISRNWPSEAFSLADCDALIKYDYAFDCRQPAAAAADRCLGQLRERERGRQAEGEQGGGRKTAHNHRK